MQANSRNHRTILSVARAAAFLFFLPAILLPAGQIVSEHIRVRIPQEREWLGRECIVELERSWRYTNGVTGGKLPRRVTVEVTWDGIENSISPSDGRVSIGMAHPAAASNMKAHLLRNAAREMARLGLSELSRGASEREEFRFLTDGMAEILAREYDGTTRALTGAWTVAHFLDRVQKLSLSAQTDWNTLSGGRSDLRSASPGITFLMTCREGFGREKALKLFEEIRKGTLEDAVLSAFRRTAPVLEAEWLDRVRRHSVDSDVTITAEEDAPVLREVRFVKTDGKSQLQVFLQDRGNDLSPGTVFVVDAASGAVLHGKAAEQRNATYVLLDLPASVDGASGTHKIEIHAVDAAGNVRIFKSSYAATR